MEKSKIEKVKNYILNPHPCKEHNNKDSESFIHIYRPKGTDELLIAFLTWCRKCKDVEQEDLTKNEYSSVYEWIVNMSIKNKKWFVNEECTDCLILGNINWGCDRITRRIADNCIESVDPDKFEKMYLLFSTDRKYIGTKRMGV